MAELPCHEDIERVLETEPKKLLARLPDNLEKGRAEEHLKIAYGYACQSRERKADR